MFEINGETRQLAIIGDPVEHSFSPQMHNYISGELGKNYVYTALHVRPADLKDAVAGIRAMGITGVNVTAPHKVAVMEYLDEISDAAKKFGAVNTIVNRNGKLYGYNTDAAGFYRSLLYAGISVQNKDILFIGAGGATQPVVMQLAMEGAKSITLTNRTQARAERLADYVQKTMGYTVGTEKTLPHYDLVINTTPVGMWPAVDACPLEDFSWIDADTAVADMIYNPAETVFLRKAREQGAKTVNGLGMLIFQGILAYELFTDTKLSDDMYEKIKKEVFKR